MSPRLIALNPDLKKLRDEGYDVAIHGGYVLLRDVPYVDANRQVKRGVLFSALNLANDRTLAPSDHVAIFAGEYPCDENGSPIERIRCGPNAVEIGGITTSFNFSAKPKPAGNYPDYYAKMSTYAAILGGPAALIDAKATAQTHPLVKDDDGGSVFRYADTASSRADITAVNEKLAVKKVAIVGLGGTGSYVLDLVAKTPVEEIHLFDGDIFHQHNAFRAPGAASGEELEEKLYKVAYFARIYSKMRCGIVEHPEYMNARNLDALQGMDFVFLCMEGPSKKAVVERLESLGTPFVDVGMGLYLKNGVLGGIVRTTTSTNGKRDHVRTKGRIPFSDGAGVNEYDKNIQIADLNALNAALAVIRWKKLFGFYADDEHEHFSTYAVGGNDINNEDAA